MSGKILNLKGMTIKADQNFLILEDEVEINELIVENLSLMGFEGSFHQAYKIEEAQKVLKTKQIDYILSDWNLPDGQGITLLKAVRSTERLKETPFMMITGNSDIQSMMDSSKIGVSEYLVKPFQYDDFEKKIAEGYMYHLVKNENFIKDLENKVQFQNDKIELLEQENKRLRDKKV